MLSYLGSPRNKTWEKDSSPSCLLGRWSQETQGGEWEVRQGRGGSQYRMCSGVGYHCGQTEFNLVRGSERPSRTHTSEFSHLNGKGAGYLSTDCHQPLVEGYSWVGCGINALALCHLGFRGQWMSKVRASSQAKNPSAGSWKSGRHEPKSSIYYSYKPKVS